jgi:hypothetical protein
MSLEEDIRSIEEEIRTTPYNKATSHHIGRLKAKLAKLREEQQSRAGKKAKKTGIRKAGDATVAMVGPIGSGRSTLLNRLTGARQKEDPYDTTIVPGVLLHKGARIQILDIPDILIGKSGEAISAVRDADMILFVVDPRAPDLGPYVEEIMRHGIRINERPPEVQIKRTSKGGINISCLVDPGIDRESLMGILKEYRIHSADLLIREALTPERFIDALEGNRRYIQGIFVMNKADLVSFEVISPDVIPVSALTGAGLDLLKDRIFERLGLIRIYMKPRGGEADLKEPMVLPKNSTVADLCDRIHKDFRRRFRYATIWGASAKHDGQRVGFDHALIDEDIITIVIQK